MAEPEELDEKWYSRPDVTVVTEGEDPDYWVLRASSIGGCPVGLAYSVMTQEEGKYKGMLPEPPDEWLQGAMDESAALEQQALDLWIDTFTEQAGCTVEVREHDDLRCELELGGDVIEGTIDFPVTVTWANGDVQDFTVEIKVVGADLHEQMHKSRLDYFPQLTGLRRKYRAQCGVYRWAIGNPVMLVIAEKAKGALTGKVMWEYYTGTGDTADERFIPNMDDLRAIIDEIEGAVASLRAGETVACPGGGDAKCKWTPLCHRVEELDDEGEEAYDVYRMAKEFVDHYTAQLDEAKERLGEIVRAKGGRVVSQSGDKITWVEQHVDESTRTVKAHDRKFLKVTPSKKVKDQ